MIIVVDILNYKWRMQTEHHERVSHLDRKDGSNALLKKMTFNLILER